MVKHSTGRLYRYLILLVMTLLAVLLSGVFWEPTLWVRSQPYGQWGQDAYFCVICSVAFLG